jgi:uncharacterized membrane protein
MKTIKQLLNYFFQGLLLIAPVAITIYVIYTIFSFLDGFIDLKIPGLGLIIVLIIITIVGYLTSTFLGSVLISLLNKALNKAPFLKTIIQSIKDLMSAFVGKKKKFSEPVRVMINQEIGLEKIGFITRSDLSSLNIFEDKVAVYFPHSFNFSGNLFLIDKRFVKPIDISASDAMKFIVSGGIIEIENIPSGIDKNN